MVTPQRRTLCRLLKKWFLQREQQVAPPADALHRRQEQQTSIYKVKQPLERQLLRCHAPKVLWLPQLRAHPTVAWLVWLQARKSPKLARVRRHHPAHLQRLKVRTCQCPIWWPRLPPVCREHPFRSVAQQDQVLDAVDASWLLKELTALVTRLQLVPDAPLAKLQDSPVRKRVLGKVCPVWPRVDVDLVKRLPRLRCQRLH